MRRWAAAVIAAGFLFFALPAYAGGLQEDPAALYARMKEAYDKGSAHGWTFNDETLYLATIMDAGRAYALLRPNDPAYLELAGLAVDVGTVISYDPLSNNDASVWYMREAAAAVVKAGDPQRTAKAQAILTRLDAFDASPEAGARAAVTDANANVERWPGDNDALLARVDADVRAYRLTNDVRYRSLALYDVARSGFPVGKLADPPGNEVVTAANSADAGVPGYTSGDRANAKIFLQERAALKDPPIIARVIALPHDERLRMTAPADEYFGHAGISVLGIKNEMDRIGRFLDSGWGSRMTAQALIVIESVTDWQKQYPHDYAMPRTLLASYQMLARITDDPDATAAANRMRMMLVVEYADSPQARQLAGQSSGGAASNTAAAH